MTVQIDMQKSTKRKTILKNSMQKLWPDLFDI